MAGAFHLNFICYSLLPEPERQLDRRAKKMVFVAFQKGFLTWMVPRDFWFPGSMPQCDRSNKPTVNSHPLSQGETFDGSLPWYLLMPKGSDR